MKINFTKKEYRLLLDLVSLGEWVITATDVDITPEKEKYEEIIQKIYSHAKDFGFENLIEYDEEIEEYIETREFDESEKDEYLRDFEENNFWEELIHRLAERDFIRKNGIQNIEKMPFELQIKDIHEIETKYSEEFSTFGLENIEIKKHNQRVNSD